MERQQLVVTGSLFALGLLLAFPIVWVCGWRWSSPQSLAQTADYASGIHRTDSNGVEWVVAPLRGRLGAPEPNDAQDMPAIVVKTSIGRTSDREVSVGLVLESRTGGQYQPRIIKGGVLLPAPTLRIADEAGKVLLKGRFQYG